MAHPRVDDPDMPLAELLSTWPATIRVFLRHSMLCVGCPIAPFHTVADACAVHGLSREIFFVELRAAVAAPLREPSGAAVISPRDPPACAGRRP